MLVRIANREYPDKSDWGLHCLEHLPSKFLLNFSYVNSRYRRFRSERVKTMDKTVLQSILKEKSQKDFFLSICYAELSCPLF